MHFNCICSVQCIYSAFPAYTVSIYSVFTVYTIVYLQCIALRFSVCAIRFGVYLKFPPAPLESPKANWSLAQLRQAASAMPARRARTAVLRPGGGLGLGVAPHTLHYYYNFPTCKTKPNAVILYAACARRGSGARGGLSDSCVRGA